MPEILHVDRIVPSKELHIVEVPMQVPGKEIEVEKLVIEKTIETIPEIRTLENYINQEVRVEVPIEFIREVFV